MLSRLNRFIFSPSLRVQRTFSVKTFRTKGALKAQFFFKTKKNLNELHMPTLQISLRLWPLQTVNSHNTGEHAPSF